MDEVTSVEETEAEEAAVAAMSNGDGNVPTRADTTGTGPSGGLPNYVRDALRVRKVKVGDLTSDQRGRADEAVEHKQGLRGKQLAAWIIEGTTPGDTIAESRDNVQKIGAKARSERARARTSTRYPEWVAPAVQSARKLSGQKPGTPNPELTNAYAGPAQHIKIREFVTKRLGEEEMDVTSENVLALSGVPSMKALREIATFRSDRASLKPLQPLGTNFVNDDKRPDGWARGRFLAAVLFVWIEELKKNEKS